MSNRALRVQRRAESRARTRAVLQAVAPADGRHAGELRPCAAPDCTAMAPAVPLGPLQLALCPAHKAGFDRQWARLSGRGSQLRSVSA